MNRIEIDLPLEDEIATLALGARLAASLKVGDIVCLTGDLGAGKTTLSRGLIKAVADTQDVPSPTYTLVQTYTGPDYDIWHFDLYRLKDPSEIWELGIEEAFEQGICLIEWPQRLGDLRPDGTLDIDIVFDDDARIAKISAPLSWANSLKEAGL